MPSIRSITTDELIAFDERLRVGRARDSDLRLDLGTISGDHAVLELREGGLYVKDLGSTNGTRVRGRRIVGWVQLKAGETVRFGPDSAWEVVAVEGPVDGRGALPTVVVLESGRSYPVTEDRFVIGASTDADLQLDVGEVPAVAAVVVLEDGARHLIPIGGEEDAPTRLLTSGSEFLVGGVRLGYRDESPGLLPTTVPERARSRSYDLGLTLIHDRPGDGRIRIDAGSAPLEFEGVPNRFVLLLVLARALHGRLPAGGLGEAGGWVEDEPLRVAIWGKGGSADRYNHALTKLVYDTRKMIAGQGLDPFFIEKSRGRTRLRLDPTRVTIEGD